MERQEKVEDALKGGETGWERQLVEQLATGALQEQRRSRRWGIFFKFLLAAYLLLLLVLSWSDGLMDLPGITKTKDHTALVKVDGIIMEDAKASADNIVSGLRAAFKDKHSKAVILRINSPGGSPVQAGYVYDEMRRLREKYPDKPLYAVISDLCASGGYYIASAADKVYASRSSMVGSIGVRMGGFGFVDAMHKLGVERRLLTAGEHKGFLDPFSPMRESEVEHVKKLLDDVYQQFIDVVRKGRGERLADNEELFSGLMWTGEQAKELGLVDGFGSTSYVAREIVGTKTLVDYTQKSDYLERLADRFGMAVGEGIATTLGFGSSVLR